MTTNDTISIKQTIDELLETSIFKEIARRNNHAFAQKLATWLVRYILIITSMHESLKIGLEKALYNLHGEKFNRILHVTEQSFHHSKKEQDNSQNYIW